MSSQTSLTTRRRFLSRSAWGFGSAFISPSLLASCTDHLIDPTNPIPFPPPPSGPRPILPELDLDWNNLAKESIQKLLSKLFPEVGDFLGDLLGHIWPSDHDNQWDQVKDQVAAYVDKAITKENYDLAIAKLSDSNDSVQLYRNAIFYSPNDYGKIKNQWLLTYNFLFDNPSTFQLPGYEVQLLPIFTQYANLYLSLLREGLQNSDKWGMSAGDKEQYLLDLQAKISSFRNYVRTTYQNGRDLLAKKTGSEAWHNEPFRTLNSYDRYMTMAALDYMDSWTYFDIQNYPDGAFDLSGKAIPVFSREIYSDPHGNSLDVNNGVDTPGIVLPDRQPTQFPTQLTIWSGRRLDAVQLTYPAGGGPNRATTTPRMGDTNGGSAQVFNGLTEDNPITKVMINVTTNANSDQHEEYTITTIQPVLSNGVAFPMLGIPTDQDEQWTIEYDGYALSSIYILGPGYMYKNESINCIVFGFMPWPRTLKL